MAYVLVCDGKIQSRTLNDSPYNENDIKKFIGKYKLKNIFLLSVDQNKKVYRVIKD